MSSQEEVIIERLDNLKEQVQNFRAENKDQHKLLQTAQNETNGKVRKLQIWRGFLSGAIAVISFITGFVILSYINLMNNVTEQRIASEKMGERVDNMHDVIHSDNFIIK